MGDGPPTSRNVDSLYNWAEGGSRTPPGVSNAPNHFLRTLCQSRRDGPLSRSRDYVFALPPMKHGVGMPFRYRGVLSPPDNWRSAIQISLYAHLCRRDDPGPFSMSKGLILRCIVPKKRMREIEGRYYICHYGFGFHPYFFFHTGIGVGG